MKLKTKSGNVNKFLLKSEKICTLPTFKNDLWGYKMEPKTYIIVFSNYILLVIIKK